MGRFVRKQSVLSKITALPLDLLISLNEQRELIDWDSYSKTIALPAGFILTLIYFAIRLWQDHTYVEKKHDHFDYKYELLKGSQYFSEEQKSPILSDFLHSVQVIITLINAINTFAFLFKTKKYVIFNKDSLSGSTSARKVSKNQETKPFLFKLLSFWKTTEDVDIDSYWELNIWNPSKFTTYLFVSFPPFNIAFLYLTQSSFANLAYLFITSIVLYFVIIKGFLVLIDDRQVLYQETFDEYQRKFVRPKLSAARREVAVDATKGPYGNDATQYYSPGRTEKVFKTHDFKGKESVEKFEHGEFTPVKKSFARNGLRRPLLTPKDKRYSMPYQPSPLSRKSYNL